MTKYHKKTFNLRRGDWEVIKEKYLEKGILPSVVVRYIISQHVDALKVDDAVVESLLEEIII